MSTQRLLDAQAAKAGAAFDEFKAAHPGDRTSPAYTTARDHAFTAQDRADNHRREVTA